MNGRAASSDSGDGPVFDTEVRDIRGEAFPQCVIDNSGFKLYDNDSKNDNK
jgi:hypothetical protein